MRKVILDCDPGHDDVLAILLACKHLDVLGITTVGGNQTVEKVTTNALKLVELAELTHIPVARGLGHGLVHPLHTAPQVHGESGLDGPDLPEPTAPLHEKHAVEFIIDTVMSTDGVTLVPAGPLTNVAAAVQKEPRLRDRVQEISLMGGSLTYGNATPAAEFNIWVDPEAAASVYRSGIHIKMCGLNLTHQVLAAPDVIERIRRQGRRTSTAVTQMLEFYSARIRALHGMEGGALHDPCAVAWLIDPTLIQGVHMHVDVEIKGELTYGMTLCDWRHVRGSGREIPAGGVSKPQGKEPNCEVGMIIDAPRFLDLLIDTIGMYP